MALQRRRITRDNDFTHDYEENNYYLYSYIYIYIYIYERGRERESSLHHVKSMVKGNECHLHPIAIHSSLIYHVRYEVSNQRLLALQLAAMEQLSDSTVIAPRQQFRVDSGDSSSIHLLISPGVRFKSPKHLLPAHFIIIFVQDRPVFRGDVTCGPIETRVIVHRVTIGAHTRLGTVGGRPAGDHTTIYIYIYIYNTNRFKTDSYEFP